MNKLINNGLFQIAVVLFLVAIPTYITSFNNTNNLVEACERQNVRTQIQYDNVIGSEEESRAFSELQPPGKIRNLTWKAAESYKKDAEDLLAVVSDVGLEKEEGSPQVDCAQAYPKPFPFGPLEPENATLSYPNE